MIGIAASTKDDSRGLVTTIIVLAPMNSTRLRSATETEVPTAALTCVVSAVSREITSPVLASSQMRDHVAPQVADDSFAERRDEVIAKRARQREHRRDADHDEEITVDQRQAARREAEVDHAPHRDRHDQRRQRGKDQRAERRERAPAVAS